MNLVLMGAPGAGKGTQANVLVHKLKIPQISTGNMLWAAVHEKTELGLMIEDLMENGALVPNEIIFDIMKQRVSKEDCKNGYILDGVPRNITQAEILEDVGVHIDKVIFIDVPDDVIIHERMVGRLTCSECGETYHVKARPPQCAGICDDCGAELAIRDDDRPETVKKRLMVYHKETEPLLDYYASRGKLVRISGQNSVEETTKLLFEALGIE